MSHTLYRLIFAACSCWEMGRSIWDVRRGRLIEGTARTAAAFGFAGLSGAA